MRFSRIARASLLGLVLAACTADQNLTPSATERPQIMKSGAPGAPPIYITEIMSDPTKVADAAGEWFEVFNAGGTAINLHGWTIVSGPSGSEHNTIGVDVIVAPAGYAVFGDNADPSLNGGVTEAYSYGGSIALNNSNTDWLELKLPDGTVVDSVSYSAHSGTTVTTPTFTPTSGASRAVIDLATEHTIMAGTDWANTPTGTTYGLGDRGTPGSGPYTALVAPGPVVTVTISPAPATAVTGGTRQFTAIGRDSIGIPSPSTYTWTSSDTAVAVIDSTGLATANAEGTTTITAVSANGKSASTLLTVTVPQPATVSISINSPRQAPVGWIKPAFPTVKDAGGATINPTPALTWTSSDTSIATVDTLGYVTAVGVGTVTITATTANGAHGSTTFSGIPATAPTTAIYRNNLEFGAPTGADPANDERISKPQYALSYNRARGGPNWVAWEENATQFGPAPRCDCFSPEPLLDPSDYHVVDFDYRNGGYDRGHMAQSEARTATDQENATTFRLSNVLPQGAENNQGPWSQFENYVNDLVQDSAKEAYIVAGGQFAASPTTLKNEGKVAVPDYTWKVVVFMNADQGLADVHSTRDIRVVAVRMPNLITPGPASSVGIRNVPWQNFQISVDSIEALTGYDVLNALPDSIENIVESGDHYPVASVGGPYAASEGSAIQFDASASSDPDTGDALTYSWNFGDGTTGAGVTPTHTYADNGSYTATVTVTDRFGAASVASAAVAVSNVAPVFTAFVTPTAPVQAGVPFTITLGEQDPGTLDTHQAAIDWGDGTTSIAAVDPSATPAHTYSSAGFYTIAVTITDKDGGSASMTSAPVVVFDPAAGFATGGGFVGSGSGKTHLSFDLRYLGSIATGSVDAVTNGNAMHFSSNTVDWLVTEDGQAKASGSGQLAGHTGTVNFELTMVSGSKPGRVGDGIRLRLTDATTGAVLYDNLPASGAGSWDVAPLSGGNLSIHQ